MRKSTARSCTNHTTHVSRINLAMAAVVRPPRKTGDGKIENKRQIISINCVSVVRFYLHIITCNIFATESLRGRQQRLQVRAREGKHCHQYTINFVCKLNQWVFRLHIWRRKKGKSLTGAGICGEKKASKVDEPTSVREVEVAFIEFHIFNS